MDCSNNLNDYLSSISFDDAIIIISCCDESTKYLQSVKSPVLNYIVEAGISFRYAFIALVDTSDDKKLLDIDSHHLKKRYDLVNKNHSLRKTIDVYSGGFSSGGGRAYFDYEKKRYELIANRGLNFIIISKETLEVIDFFCVDTFYNERLTLWRYDKISFFNLILNIEAKIDNLLQNSDQTLITTLDYSFERFHHVKNKYSNEELICLLSIITKYDKRYEPHYLDESIRFAIQNEKSIPNNLHQMSSSTDKKLSAKACDQLADLYISGIIVNRNIDYAIHLLKKAYEIDSKYAKKYALVLSKSIFLEDRIHAYQLLSNSDWYLKARIVRSFNNPKDYQRVCDYYLNSIDQNLNNIDDATSYILSGDGDNLLDRLFNYAISEELITKKRLINSDSSRSHSVEVKIKRVLSGFVLFVSEIKRHRSNIKIICNDINFFKEKMVDVEIENSIETSTAGNYLFISLLDEDDNRVLNMPHQIIPSSFVYICSLAYSVGLFCKNNEISLNLLELPRRSRMIFSYKEYQNMDYLSFPGFNMFTQKQYDIKEYSNNTECRNFVLSGKWAQVHDNGVHRELIDQKTEYMNIINNKRVTCNNGAHWKTTTYFYGPCVVRGLYVTDQYTIPSLYQKRCTMDGIDNRTINCGVDGYGVHLDLEYILSTLFHKNDKIFIINWTPPIVRIILKMCGAKYEDLSDLFSSHCYENLMNDQSYIFKDETHFSEQGNEQLVNHIYTKYGAPAPNIDENSEEVCFGLNNYIDDAPPELRNYLTYISKFRKQGKNGAIVMNCNPFTNGHRYLIECASQQVDNLYIFVVEEDRSFFNFNDRINLVKKGTSDIDNVLVINSGKFIISQVTFPQYFDKDGNQEIKVDASRDIGIFGKYVAPQLGISVRFVGEEPLDVVTNQYNMQMKKNLPLLGVELIEIPRKENSGTVISASLVRKSIKEKNWNAIKGLVPSTTYEYILEKFKR